MSTAPLKIKIESQEVPTATKRLEALRLVGKNVETQVKATEAKAKKLGSAVQSTGNAANKATSKVKKASSAIKNLGESGDIAATSLGKASKGMGAFTKALGPIGTFVGAVAGMTGGLVAAGGAAAAAAKEIEVMSQRANTDTTTMQEWAFATAKVGVDMNDLSDVLQDTNDKLADFRETGAGELVDFFENIAPKVGITADAFRDLSGPEALQLYYDSLEKAGLSQQEMTFYMESLASESTRLIPLLQDQSKELNDLRSKAQEFGVALTEIELKRLEEVGGEFNKLKHQLTTELIRAVSQFDEVIKSSLEGISWAINEVARGFDRFMDSFRSESAKRSITGIDAAIEEIYVKREEYQHKLERWEGDNTRRGKEYAQQMREGLTDLKRQYDLLIDRKKELLKPENDRLKAASGTMTVDRVRTDNPGMPDPDNMDTATRKAAAAQAKLDAARAASAAKASARQQALMDAEAERQKELYQKEEEALRESRGRQYQTLLDSFKSEEELVSESYRKRMEIILLNTEEGSRARHELQKKLAEEFASDSLEGFGEGTASDQLEAEMAKINEDFEARRQLILENTAITEEQRTELEMELTRRRNDMLAAMEKQKTEATVNATSDMFSNLATATKAYAGEQSKEYKAMFAVSRAFSIAQTTMKTYEAAQGAYSAMASIPYVGPFLGAAAAAAAVAAGMASVASVKSTSFAGAFDKGGSIPAGQIGLVGEYGPELVEGPMTVTSRKETAKMFREGGQGEGTAPQSQPNNIRIINTVDPSVMGDYLGSDAGEEIIMNVIRGNGSQIQQIVGG